MRPYVSSLIEEAGVHSSFTFLTKYDIYGLHATKEEIKKLRVGAQINVEIMFLNIT